MKDVRFYCVRCDADFTREVRERLYAESAELYTREAVIPAFKAGGHSTCKILTWFPLGCGQHGVSTTVVVPG